MKIGIPTARTQRFPGTVNTQATDTIVMTVCTSHFITIITGFFIVTRGLIQSIPPITGKIIVPCKQQTTTAGSCNGRNATQDSIVAVFTNLPTSDIKQTTCGIVRPRGKHFAGGTKMY
jgi:hypothetical protein